MTNTVDVDDRITTIPANIINSETLNLNTRSYAGYAQADYKGKNAQLFYWFFESQTFHPDQSRDKKEIGKTPLIIWLNGGPGAPSTLGLFLENGPYLISPDSNGKLTENEYSWNQKVHVIYWDQPIGTGYSCIENEHPETTYMKNEDELSEVFYQSMQYFLSKHPEYASCPVYVTGESYGGKYVPNIAMKIHKNNKKSKGGKKINLKGFAVGDGWIDAKLQMKVYIDYAYMLGYLDTFQKEQMLTEYTQLCTALDNKDWRTAYDTTNAIVANVSALGGGFNFYDIRSFSEVPITNIETYMRLPAVKNVLGIQQNQEWKFADNTGPVADNLIEDNVINSRSVYSDFIKHDELYKVLMYTATFDTACGSLSTELILYDLNKWETPGDNEAWKTQPRKVWAQPHNHVKGFIKQYKNLTQIVIPNSGHEVPYYQPEVSRDMIYKWINDDVFPTYFPKLTKT